MCPISVLQLCSTSESPVVSNGLSNFSLQEVLWSDDHFALTVFLKHCVLPLVLFSFCSNIHGGSACSRRFAALGGCALEVQPHPFELARGGALMLLMHMELLNWPSRWAAALLHPVRGWLTSSKWAACLRSYCWHVSTM